MSGNQLTFEEARALTRFGDPAWGREDGEPLLAVDPGDRHVGLAKFLHGKCTDAWEMAPHQYLLLLERALQTGTIKVLVYEKFALYPWLAESQAYSEFETSQLIGATKWLWSKHGEGCLLVGQTAEIKIPTKAIAKAKGIKSVAARLKAGGHALDAELHGLHYLLNADSGQTQTEHFDPQDTAASVAAVNTRTTARKAKPTGATGAAKAVKKAVKKGAIPAKAARKRT